jgi:hypothetical protein
MKILQVGSFFSGPEITDLKFLSNKYILDYDLLIVNLNALKNEIYLLLRLSNGYTSPNHDDHLADIIASRKMEILEFYRHGGNIIFIANEYIVLDYKIQYGTLEEASINLLDIFLNDKEIKFEPLVSDIVESDSIISTISDGYNFSFHASFDKYNGHKLLWTKKVKRTVGFSKKIESGLFVCLPEIMPK